MIASRLGLVSHLMAHAFSDDGGQQGSLMSAIGRADSWQIIGRDGERHVLAVPGWWGMLRK